MRMKKGGWLHTEARRGLTRVKHPCFYQGDKLSRRRDADTPDMFEAKGIQIVRVSRKRKRLR